MQSLRYTASHELDGVDFVTRGELVMALNLLPIKGLAVSCVNTQLLIDVEMCSVPIGGENNRGTEVSHPGYSRVSLSQGVLEGDVGLASHACIAA